MRVRRAPPGFTLVELLVALVILTVVGGAIYRGLARQQRLFRSIALVLATRSDVRDGAEILAADMSVVSMSDTLGLAADSAIEFLGMIGASALAADPGGASIRLVEEGTDEDGPGPTSFTAMPDTGDIALVFNANGAGSGTWMRRRIMSVSTDGGAMVVALDSSVDAAMAGAPVRFLRRARYSLYRSTDSRWYLGYRRCNAAGSHACGTIQPVSGPYSRYGGEDSGLIIRYFDFGGALVEQPGARHLAARVEIRLHADAGGLVELGRSSSAPHADSSATAVAFRLLP